MLKSLILVSSLSIFTFALTIEKFKKEQIKAIDKDKQEFSLYRRTQDKRFNSYQEAQIKAYSDYKKELQEFWKNPKLSTKKAWVSYTENMKTRTDVDFEKETIVIDTIASSKEVAKQKLQSALAKVVTIDTKSLHETDPLQKKINKIKIPKDVLIDEVTTEPILSTVIFDKKPSKETIKDYVEEKVVYSDINVKKSIKVKDANIYSIKVKLPKDTMIKRSKIYYKEVKKQSSLQKLPISLVFAIMHSESSFNPYARSSVPAYGLMQIVPSTAGIDSYLYLYNEKKLVSGAYLYNSRNNITMGSAYLHILYYRYLKKIKNTQSRLYCTIAAYNTGAGNVAWAFTQTNNINKSTTLINNMSSDEVYDKLLQNLKYDEAKHYLKKVRKRVITYHKLYGS